MLHELIQFASNLNFNVQNFELDGKIHRFDRNGKGNAWYVGFQVFSPKTGEPFPICVLGDWKSGEKHEFKPTRRMAKEEKEHVNAKIAEAAEKAEAERKEKQDLAAEKAKRIVSQMSKSIRCGYVERKKIAESPGIGTQLLDDGRVLIIPMIDEKNEIVGAQRIFPDGKKLFISGQKTSGAFHVIGQLNGGDIILTEGYATGSSLRQATSNTVVVCFNCHNLVTVSKIIRKKFPSASIIIAGDDDQWTEGNPGKTKAIEAAKACGGKAVFPSFLNPEKGKTDFNDLHCDEGLETVASQIAPVEPDPTGYIPLGADDGYHYFYIFKDRSIVKTKSFTETCMYEIMPKEYWEAAYAGKKGILWSQAKSDIIQTSKNVGPFNPSRIRGMGPWIDQGKIVINTGKDLVIDGKVKSLSEFKSWYVYVRTKHSISIHPNPLDLTEAAYLRNACEELKWRDKKSAHLLAGWIAIARIAGALPIRPHVWLTGSSGTGKSTVLERIVKPSMGKPGGHYPAQGGSTEAGIRQEIKADSIPIVFDEFETKTNIAQPQMAAIIELLRQSWSMSSGYIVKGSSDGNATHYSMNYAAFVSGIRINLENEADKSRFSILELAPHGSDTAEWDRVLKYFDPITEEYGERLFSRMIKMIPVVMDSFKILQTVIAKKISQRAGQQYGMLLAGWYTYYSDSPITEEIAEDVINELELKEEKEQSEETDEMSCLTHLLTTKISVQIQVDSGGLYSKEETKRADMSIVSIISSGNKYLINSLTNYGILVESDFVHIHKNHSALRKFVFSGTRWPDWARSLKRLPGAVCDTGHKKRFGGNPEACISIPIKLIIN